MVRSPLDLLQDADDTADAVAAGSEPIEETPAANESRPTRMEDAGVSASALDGGDAEADNVATNINCTAQLEEAAQKEPDRAALPEHVTLAMLLQVSSQPWHTVECEQEKHDPCR